MESYDMIIVGAGPAGMSAAAAASRSGLRILVLEQAGKVGKKILVTGNGRCNLTNQVQDIGCYRTEEPDKVREILRQFTLEDTFDFFRKLGILTRNKNGYIYPYNEQASAVREAFALMLKKNKNITVKTDCHVDSAEAAGHAFLIHTSEAVYRASTLILTTGGLAGPGSGADRSGYRIARSMGHHLIPTYPALTALYSSAPFLKKASGVRCQAGVTLYCNGESVAEESGEVQWTDRGISGICIFQLSRYAILALEEGQKVSVSLDLMKEWDHDCLYTLLKQIIEECPYKSPSEVLRGILPRKLTDIILKEAGLDREDRNLLIKPGKIKALVGAIKAFPLKINGYGDYGKAQVTRGGIPLSEVSSVLESVCQSGLFFAGEILDVDGTCGGYNLQWAFSSGNVAGKAAAARTERMS